MNLNLLGIMITLDIIVVCLELVVIVESFSQPLYPRLK
jgi:hypothetical protein